MTFQKFPELIRQTTVEKWLPAHAACINGNTQVLELLLKYPYPPNVLIKLRYTLKIFESMSIIKKKKIITEKTIGNLKSHLILIQKMSMVKQYYTWHVF